MRTCCHRRSQGTPAGPSIRGPADCITCAATTFSGRSREAVAEACKAAVFLLQAKLYAEQGIYCRRRSDLEQHLTGQDLELLQTAQALKAGECREDLTALTDRLFAWCRDVIGQQKAI